MKALPVYDQPWVEWLDEAYLPITPENIKEVVMRTGPDRELTDEESLLLYNQPWQLFAWLDEGIVAFVPYEKCQVYFGDLIRSYDIEDIEIAAPKVKMKGVAEGTECFVIHLLYW
jgi:hypothetical protein